MKGKHNINGIILAGGKSERMGTSKAFLEFRGKPFIWHCIEALKPLVNEIIVVSDDPRFDDFQVFRIPDTIKDVGPVGGLYSGLTYSKTQFNLVLSCDVPFIKTELLRQLIDAAEETIDVVQLASESTSHPLIALYQKRCASYLVEQLSQNERRLRRVITFLRTKTVSITGPEALQLKNINTREEYNALNYEIDH